MTHIINQLNTVGKSTEPIINAILLSEDTFKKALPTTAPLAPNIQRNCIISPTVQIRTAKTAIIIQIARLIFL